MSRFVQPTIVVTFAVLALTIVWFFGGNQPYVRTISLLGSTLAMGLLLFQTMFQRRVATIPALVWILLFGVVYVWSQQVPWIAEIFSCKRPIQVRPASAAEGVEPDNAEYAATLTTYPAATRQRLAELLLGISAFLIGTQLCAQPRQLRWVLAAIAVNGVLVGFTGIAQRISWNGKIFWAYPLLRGGLPFGPFVNRNNSGTFLLISISAMSFFVIEALIRQAGRGRDTRTAQDSSRNRQPIWDTVMRRFGSLRPQAFYLLLGGVVFIASLLATFSRGAIVATLATAAVFGVVTLRYRARAILWVVPIGIAAVFVLGYSRQLDDAFQRVGTMADAEASTPLREHWSDGLQVAKAYLPWGSGAGTYRLMYPPFQLDSQFNRWFQHAENQYLETLAELGWPGVALLAAAIFLFAVNCLWLLRQHESFDRALGWAGAMSLVGVAVAAILDYGLFQPANSVLFGLFCGLLVGRKAFHDATLVRFPRVSRAIWIAVFAGIFTVDLWAVREMYAVDLRRDAARRIDWFDPQSQNATLRLQKSQRLLDDALAIRPDDSELHYLKAEAYVLQYRLTLTGQFLAEVDPQTQIPLFDAFEKAWELTSLPATHRVARINEAVDPDQLAAMRASLPTTDYLRPAFDEYQLAEGYSPHLPQTLVRLAMLWPLVGADDSVDAEMSLLEEALFRSPNDSDVLYNAGLLAVDSNRTEQAIRCWARCMRLTKMHDEPIVRFGRASLPAGRFLNEVLPADPYRLVLMAQSYFDKPEDALSRRALLKHTRGVLENSKLASSETFFLAGEIDRLDGQFETAADNYRKALELEPRQISWRIAYAESLMEQKDYSRAIAELQRCQPIDGKNENRIKRLLRQIEKFKLTSIE